MKTESISYQRYISRAPDHEFWKPIPDEHKDHYNSMLKRVETAFKGADKKEKGASLEDLMTYIFSRFEDAAEVFPNQRNKENQFDHIVEFIDGMVPLFIKDHIGLTIIGESKNHNKSIGSREVGNLYDLLHNKEARVGIFSSINSFAKGKKSMWANAEGKRRKLCLMSDRKRYVVGFTLKELSSLLERNFYTMLKQKIRSLQDELNDDFTEDEGGLPYHERLHCSLVQLKNLGIITDDSYSTGKVQIEKLYGELNVDIL